METTVIIALGSNRRHGRFGAPAQVVDAAIADLEARGVRILARSRIHVTDPVGPSERMYANAAVLAATALAPEALLTLLKSVERDFGRRRQRRWGARVLDLDLIAYGRAVVPTRLGWRTARGLVVPHRAMHQRRFVLDPVVEIAPDWRHPVLGLSTRELHARLTKARSVD